MVIAKNCVLYSHFRSVSVEICLVQYGGVGVSIPFICTETNINRPDNYASCIVCWFSTQYPSYVLICVFTAAFAIICQLVTIEKGMTFNSNQSSSLVEIVNVKYAITTHVKQFDEISSLSIYRFCRYMMVG